MRAPSRLLQLLTAGHTWCPWPVDPSVPSLPPSPEGVPQCAFVPVSPPLTRIPAPLDQDPLPQMTSSWFYVSHSQQWSHRPDVASGGTRARPPQARDRSSARAKPWTLGRLQNRGQSPAQPLEFLAGYGPWGQEEGVVTECRLHRARARHRSPSWADRAEQGAVHEAAPELCSSGSRMYVCGQGRPRVKESPGLLRVLQT